MPDETPKPILPKRPTKAKQPKKSLQELEDECLTLTTREKACALLLGEMETPDYPLIATKLHMDLGEVMELMDSPSMKHYLLKLQDKELTEFARLKVRKLRKVGVNRGAIEERLFDLMMMDPSETKGSIDGQVKAAAALADKFGFASKEDPLAGKTPAELEAIVSKGHSRLIEGRTSGIQ